MACDRKDAFNIQMRFEMIRQRVKRGLDLVGVTEGPGFPARGQSFQKTFAKRIGGKKSVQIGADDAPVC